MATSAQLKALFKSYADGDDGRFFTYAMQISAHEARHGHGKLAKELRDIIDEAKQKKGYPRTCRTDACGKKKVPQQNF